LFSIFSSANEIGRIWSDRQRHKRQQKAAGGLAPVAHVDAIAQRSSFVPDTYKKNSESKFALNVPAEL
jgi:hypothetical protein